jgi:ABC-type nitrate/sulfonate/bicarbonate transport system substrate-binding protein
MKKITIVGVPEHFNTPWEMAINSKAFKSQGIDLEWHDVPEGTGKMCEMLRNGDADMAVILTEGIVKDITAGNPSKIVQEYVASPLLWGIHVAANSKFETISDLKNHKAAISRLGSGSQLMAYVNAKNQGWNTSDLQFEIVNTIHGAVDALTNQQADYFMWELFMTKPLVDQGVFRCLGYCPTPWPCFVIAVRNETLETNKVEILTILNTINSLTKDFKSITDISKILAEKFKQKHEDIITWLEITNWSQKNISAETLLNVQSELKDLNLIDEILDYEVIVKKI